MKKEDKKNFDQIIKELTDMDTEEFTKFLEEDRDFEIAKILEDGGFLDEGPLFIRNG